MIIPNILNASSTRFTINFQGAEVTIGIISKPKSVWPNKLYNFSSMYVKGLHLS